MNETEFLEPPNNIKAHILVNWFSNLDGTLLAFYRHSGSLAIATIGKTGLVETFSVLPSALDKIY